MVDASDLRRIENGPYDEMGYERSCQIDQQRASYSDRRVRTFSLPLQGDLDSQTFRVPSVVSSILDSPDLARERSFETVFYGGAPPSGHLAGEVRARWPTAGL